MSEPAPVAFDLGQVTRAHLNIRNARAQLKADFDKSDLELKQSQEKLEAVMLNHLNTHGMESVRTEAGTFYRQLEIKPSAGDWQAVYDWVKAHDAWDLLERRLKKTFIAEFMEQHNGELPPGVNVIREWVMRVRKSS